MTAGDVTAASEWIRLLVEDERRRDGARQLEVETAARKADLVRVQGRRLIEELHATMKRDVEAFQQEFSGDRARQIVFEGGPLEGAFEVRKPEHPAASLSVAPRLDAGVVGCHYRFTPNTGLPPREDRFELVFAGEGAETLQIKHLGTGQVFLSADALSEYLLTPVLKGRSR